MINDDQLHVNEQSWQIFQDLVAKHKEHNLNYEIIGRTTVLHCSAAGLSDEVGLLVVKSLCGGPYTHLSISDINKEHPYRELSITFDSKNIPPALLVLGSQFPGWIVNLRFNTNTKKKAAFYGVISGPIRFIVQEPKTLFQELHYKEKSVKKTVLVIDGETEIPLEFITYISRKCNILTKNIGVIAINSNTNPGTIVLASRVVEMAIFKAVSKKYFSSQNIVSTSGKAPIIPEKSGDTGIEAYAKGIDAIVYSGEVFLQTTGIVDDILEKTADHIVANNSPNYVKSMIDIIRDAKDAQDIDTEFLAPAKITIENLDTGKKHIAGELNFGKISHYWS